MHINQITGHRHVLLLWMESTYMKNYPCRARFRRAPRLMHLASRIWLSYVSGSCPRYCLRALQYLRQVHTPAADLTMSRSNMVSYILPSFPYISIILPRNRIYLVAAFVFILVLHTAQSGLLPSVYVRVSLAGCLTCVFIFTVQDLRVTCMLRVRNPSSAFVHKTTRNCLNIATTHE